jgi:hypothetical protein
MDTGTVSHKCPVAFEAFQYVICEIAMRDFEQATRIWGIMESRYDFSFIEKRIINRILACFTDE